MAVVKRVAAGVVAYWCAGCLEYHEFGAEKVGFNGDYERPTFPAALIITERGVIKCNATIREGIIHYGVMSRHSLAGQRMELSRPKL